jgi:hypothetical protein
LLRPDFTRTATIYHITLAHPQFNEKGQSEPLGSKRMHVRMDDMIIVIVVASLLYSDIVPRKLDSIIDGSSTKYPLPWHRLALLAMYLLQEYVQCWLIELLWLPEELVFCLQKGVLLANKILRGITNRTTRLPPSVLFEPTIGLELL